MVLKVKDATFQYDSSLLIGEPFQLKEIQLEVKEVSELKQFLCPLTSDNN